MSTFTHAVWVKRKSSTGYYSAYVSQGNSGGQLGFAGTYNDGTSMCNYNGNVNFDTGYTWPLNTWVHFGWTHTGGVWNCYINGALQDTWTDFGAISGTQYSLGKDPGSSFSGDVEFCGWRVWSGTALSAGQLTSEMNSATVVLSTNLFADYRLASAAAAATDGSGNGRTLTISGLTDSSDEPSVYGGGGGGAGLPFFMQENVMHGYIGQLSGGFQ